MTDVAPPPTCDALPPAVTGEAVETPPKLPPGGSVGDGAGAAGAKSTKWYDNRADFDIDDNKKPTARCFSIDVPVKLDDLSALQSEFFNLIPPGSTKPNSTAPFFLHDVYIVANRLEDERGESVGLTRLDVHLGYSVKQATILALLDRQRFPCIKGESFFMTSDKSTASQIARKSLAFNRGSVIRIGNPPKQDATTMAAYADALERHATSWEARAAKRLDLLNYNQREHERILTTKDNEIALLKQRIQELEAQQAESASSGPKRRRLDEHTEERVGKIHDDLMKRNAELSECNKTLAGCVRKFMDRDSELSDAVSLRAQNATLQAKVRKLSDDNEASLSKIITATNKYENLLEKHDKLRDEIESRVKDATRGSRMDLLCARKSLKDIKLRFRRASRLLGKITRADPGDAQQAEVANAAARLAAITRDRIERDWSRMPDDDVSEEEELDDLDEDDE